ncbi:MAG: hypothetical protein RIR00_2656, partial [Pseudomonadota bacterium]
MNHAYRLIWNEQTRNWVAVAEIVRAHGKRSGGTVRARGYRPLVGFGLKLLAALMILMGAPAQAGLDVNTLPTGGNVMAGNAGFNQNGSTLTVQQSSQRAVIDWQSFNIGSNAAVVFQQPDSSAIALNRVLGAEASQIYGRLTANGQIFLLNPHGMLFARGAQVNVGSLLASTLQMSNADFMAGNYQLSTPGSGSIVNAGTLNATGSVVLLGNTVANSGQIYATTATLAAGNRVALDLSGDGLIRARITDPALRASIENSGSIDATAAITLSAGQAKNALDRLVNNSGVLRASGLTQRGGDILLEAADVTNTGSIAASGNLGGGSVKLMGDMEGGTVKTGGTLSAEARQSGDGGFIETSAAHVKVDSLVKVSTAAKTGRIGSWLIDPSDVVIAASGGDMTGAALSNSLNTTSITVATQPAPAAGNGDIFVNDAISWTGNSVLTLSAHRNIQIGANITASGNTAGLRLYYGGSSEGVGPSNYDASYSLLNGAKVTLSGANPTLWIGGDEYTVINRLGSSSDPSLHSLHSVRLDPDSYYALGDDIDASSTSVAAQNYVPITDFNGILDGLGHRIDKLTINRSGYDYVGLFGTVTDSATIRNLNLSNFSITGHNFVGGIAGENYGTIKNVSVSGTLSGHSAVGGVVGANYGHINYATSTVDVSGDNSLGGIAGTNNLNSNIDNSAASGSVSGQADLGGIVGRNTGTFSNSHYDVDSFVLTVNGQKQTQQLTIGAMYSSQYSDWSSHGRSLKISDYFSQSADGYYLVGTTQNLKDLLGFADNSNYDFRLTQNIDLSPIPGWHLPYLETHSFNGNGYILSNLYIDQQFNASKGLFGQISNSGYVGKLGVTGAQVKGGDQTGVITGYNRGILYDSYAYGNVQGNEHVGGLVGQNSGQISQSYADVNVSGIQKVGGLAGSNVSKNPSLPDSYSSASIINTYSLGNVTGTTEVGGLIGYNRSFLRTSYATGAVSGSTVTGGLIGNNGAILSSSYTNFWDSDTTGQTRAIGGVFGDDVSATTGTSAVTSISGTSAFSRTTYRSFNFASTSSGIWWNSEGSTRPILRSEYNTRISNAHQLELVNLDQTASYTLVGDIDLSLTRDGNQLWNTQRGFSPITSDAGFSGSLDGQGHAINNLYLNRSTTNYIGLFSRLGSGTISNLTLSNVLVTGAQDTGALVGKAFGGSITNVSSSGTVTGTTYTGGLVGYNAANVSNSSSSAKVIGEQNVGGLIGTNEGVINNASASGNVSGTAHIGGLIGWNSEAVKNSSASGTVQGQSDLGGLIGTNTSNDVENVAASGKVTGLDAADNVGGLIGYNSGEVKKSHASGTVSGQTYVGGLIGWNDANLSAVYATGNVTGTSSTALKTGGLVGLNWGDIDKAYASGTVSGVENVGGLIGWNYANLRNVYSTGQVSGVIRVGGLIGFQSTSNLDQAFSSGAVSASSGYVGGLIGENYGSLNNVYTTSQVSGAATLAGGLVGANTGSITHAYATGNVTATGATVGALIGANDNAASLSGVFWQSGALPGIAEGSKPSGAQSKTATQLRTQSTFTDAGWDIATLGGDSSVWRIYDGSTMPLLRVFMNPLTITADNISKTYDGTTVTALSNATYSVAGAAGSALLLNGSTPYSGAVNAGTYKPTLYSSQLGYDISYSGGTLSILPKTLTAALTGTISKTYDGSTDAALSSGNFSLTGLVGSESMTVGKTSGSYNSKDVVSANSVSTTLSGADFTAATGTLTSNYTLPTTASGTASITAKTLAAALTGTISKTYDGTTDAALNSGNFSLSGLVGSESLTVGKTSGSYNSKDVVSANSVSTTLSNADFTATTGTLTSNYVLPTTASGTASITAKTLAAALTGTISKTYDGTTDAALGSGNFSLTGLVGSESLTVGKTSGSYNSKDVVSANS